jgi:hypothetical protein
LRSYPGDFADYIDVLRSFAYDGKLFERSVGAMVKIVTAGELDEKGRAAEMLASLFHLCLSGTHATIDKRLSVVETLLRSTDPSGGVSELAH